MESESSSDEPGEVLYLLTHEYQYRTADGGGPFDEVKILGIFRNKETARSFIPDLMKQPGFSQYPDGFWLRPLEVDTVGWEEGFFQG